MAQMAEDGGHGAWRKAQGGNVKIQNTNDKAQREKRRAQSAELWQVVVSILCLRP